MKLGSMSITMGISYAIMMSVIFYQSMGISGIAIGLMFGLSMAMAFNTDEKEEEDEDK
ncbi:hypothetical protein GCM10007190_06880 [Macrococcus hajekii]|uniref:hypothetical protein n=1 Tax=Macrococcus hajekii TaxID=198482 RepID=UPI00140C0A55|nr:hypothetical protein [Macrococcus hajekii]GGB01433.1 hypothetical protein GCM10007190_06880 [Macrococcus hajekii]